MHLSWVETRYLGICNHKFAKISIVGPTVPSNNLELVLPASLHGVTQYHMDFIKCDDLDTANTVKELMQQQWFELVKPRCRVKVTIWINLLMLLSRARTHFISKLSFDCCYFFATAEAEVTVSGSDSTRMFQFRDLSESR